jgi:hypothetical protein
MLKKIFLIINLIVIVFLTACSKNNNTNQGTGKGDNVTNTPTNTIAEGEPTKAVGEPTKAEEEPDITDEAATIKDYFPFYKNTRYIYEGEGNEYAGYVSYSDFTTENRIQLRTNNGGTETVKVLEYKNGELTTLFSRDECYYRDNFIETNENKGEILLKEPLTLGTEWTLKDGSKRYISNVNIEIETPAGTFKALEVTTEGDNEKRLDYYAYQVGLVQTSFITPDLTIKSLLSKIEEEVPVVQTVKFYYPNADDVSIYSEYKELSFYTNDITSILLEQGIKELTNDKYDPIISTNTKINSLYLNNNIVCVDFSKDLISDMKAGAGYEGLILQCITNTLGAYYGVNEVYITVDGNPYESGHILMKEGETFKVNMERIVE